MPFFIPMQLNKSEMVVAPLCTQSSSHVYFEELGKGKYGEVFDVKYEGKLFAAKAYLKVEPQELVKIFTELMEKGLQHENIVAYHNVCNVAGGNNRTVVLMERIQQNLPQVLKDRPDMDASTTLSILLGMAHGLAFLHSKGIIHCDLIPSNILLTVPDLKTKISDYGNSLVRPISSACTKCRHEDLDYLPPETFECETYEYSFDVFSFGHLSLYIVLKKHPYPLKSRNFMLENKKIPRTEVERRHVYINEMSERIKCSILEPLLKWTTECLDDDEHMRPHMVDFDNHMAQ